MTTSKLFEISIGLRIKIWKILVPGEMIVRAVEMTKKEILNFTNKETVECSGSTNSLRKIR